MPKKVDHDERRQDIAQAVARLAAARGLGDVSFRTVATEAGMSVALVQHYFGTKHNMLVGTLDWLSAVVGDQISERLASLAPNAGPLDRIREVAAAFIPIDPIVRDAMLVYHGFASAALADPDLRSAEAFSRGWATIDFFAEQLREGRDLGDVDAAVDANREALGLLSLVLGLSLSVLLEQVTPQDAIDTLDYHLHRLAN